MHNSPELPTTSQYTLASWLDEWMETYKSCSVKPETGEMYRGIIKLIKTCAAASMELSSVSERDMQRLLNELHMRRLDNPYSKSILSKVKLTLNQAFRTAKREKFVEVNPCNELIIPESPTKEVFPLTHAEQARLEIACSDDKLGHLFVFLLRTGLRLKELCNLKWCDYDDQKGTIYIRKSKTPAGIRYVWLIAEAKAIIEAQPRINEFIFNNTRKKPLTESSICCLYQRLRIKADIPFLTTHVCRHTFVTRLCEKGRSAKAIAQIIGHANTDYVLDIYAVLEKQELRKAIFVLEEIEDVQQNELILKLPEDLYQILVRSSASSGLPIDSLIIQQLKLMYKKKSATA